MSIRLVEEEVARFVASPHARAICIAGKWGVGKTHAWMTALNECRRTGLLKRDYSYVSLFGLNSLPELKYAIFENTQPIDRRQSDVTFENLLDRLEAKFPKFRKSLWLGKLIPQVGGLLAGALPSLFLTVRDQLVCIDDLERKGDGLAASDVLGIASFLKEQRNCSVVLLLNDDALQGDDKKQFESYLEKVFDSYVVLRPTAAECLAIGLKVDSPLRDYLVEDCTALGISNIRVLRRIEEMAIRLYELLQDFNQAVVRDAIHTLTLLAWSRFEPDLAPPVSFITNRGENYFDDETPVTEQQGAWNAILDAYRLSYLNELDIAILRSIQVGYFDPAVIKHEAGKLDASTTANSDREKYRNAVDDFYYAFSDPNDESLDALKGAFLDGVRSLSVRDLNHIFSLLTEAGRLDDARHVQFRYLSEHRDKPADFFDPENEYFPDAPIAPGLASTLAALREEKTPEEPLEEILARLADHDGWHKDDESKLANTDVSEYVSLFKSRSGERLSKLIRGAFNFRNISNTNSDQAIVNQKVAQALSIIGAESEMNARRVRRLGINVPSTPENAQGQP